MGERRILHLRFIAMLVAAAAALPVLAKESAAQGGVKLEGRIQFAEGTRPASGAVLSAIHLESGKAYRAEPASSGGFYMLRGLPYGYYQFSIETGATVHAAMRPVNVIPGRARELNLILHASKAAGGETGAESSAAESAELLRPAEEEVLLPVLNVRATATAEVVEEKISFFKTRPGVATLIGGSLLILLLK